MKKKTKINENSHKKKYYKIHQGKSQLIDRPYHNNPNIEEHKVNNIEKYNKNYIEQKRIYSIENNKDKKENTFNFYNPDKFVNGLVNDDIDSILNDLPIQTKIKEEIGKVLLSDVDIKTKRIQVRKLNKLGVSPKYITLFIKLLEYMAEV